LFDEGDALEYNEFFDFWSENDAGMQLFLNTGNGGQLQKEIKRNNGVAIIKNVEGGQLLIDHSKSGGMYTLIKCNDEEMEVTYLQFMQNIIFKKKSI
jgi:hypothetical protein